MSKGTGGWMGEYEKKNRKGVRKKKKVEQEIKNSKLRKRKILILNYCAFF